MKLETIWYGCLFWPVAILATIAGLIAAYYAPGWTPW